jgi:hypothetical protein
VPLSHTLARGALSEQKLETIGRALPTILLGSLIK